MLFELNYPLGLEKDKKGNDIPSKKPLFDVVCQTGLISPAGLCPIRQSPEGIDVENWIVASTQLIEALAAL
jgi:hypothetical protein